MPPLTSSLRIVAEMRGSRVLSDVFGGALPYMAQISDQKLLAPLAVPEAAAYPANMKSDVWVATDTQFYVIGCNTNLVKKSTSLEASKILRTRNGKTPSWANLGTFKCSSVSPNANTVAMKSQATYSGKSPRTKSSFKRGHSQLVEFLVAGQRAV